MVRKRLELDERRDQLVGLGLGLFSDRTYADVSIDDIAQAAGISKGLLYHYFPNKRAFYLETIRVAAGQLIEATAPDESLPQAQRAVAGLTAYLDYVSAHAGAYTALLRSGIGVDEEVAALVEHTRETFQDRMLSSLGIDEPRPVFRTMARAWIGGVEAASLDWLAHHDIERDQLVPILLTQLYWTLRTAMFFDPDAGVALDGPAPF